MNDNAAWLRPKILVVDDESANREIVRHILGDAYQVVEAGSAEEALRLLDDRFAVVLCDQRMPERSGISLLAEIRTRYPGISRVLVTGFPDLQILADAINKAGVRRYLSKPYSSTELLLIVRQEVEHVRLQYRNEQLEEFVREASHDLRAPLRTISSFAQLLEEKHGVELPEEASGFVQHILGGTQRLRVLLDGLLAYLRAESSQLRHESVALAAVLADVHESLRASFGETDARLTSDPLPVVSGDASQLGQVFENLIANAIKFRRESPPTIRIAVTRDGDEWLITFEDNGIGIHPEMATRVFQPFHRLHSAADYPGSGLGLAISKVIVERHGGSIGVESIPGVGSKFKLRLPALPRTAPIHAG
jgi:signal transduction histidine kinase